MKKKKDNSELIASLKLDQHRRQIRASLAQWCRTCGFEPARHHRLLISELEKLTNGENDRLAIFMPPGSAKSTYTSVLFPPWFLARFPAAQMIAASHTQELADNWGRRVRNLIAEHGPTLGIKLSEESGAAHRWETTAGGLYFAVGVGGALPGRRGDLVVIDDPLRSWEDANSELIREKQWNWYITDVQPRLKPGARIALIQTRWHEDDLAGRILNSKTENWKVISLPAIAEANDALGRSPGEWLWDDDSYGYNKVLELQQKTQFARNWTALFQQRPAPEEGDYFKVAWLKPYDALPDLATLQTYGGSDYAVTSAGGDYTVHVVVGVDPSGALYLLDLWRRQASADDWIEGFCDLVLKWKPLGWAQEVGQIKSGVGPFLERRMRERRAYVAMETFPTRGDKSVRAQSIRGIMAVQGLHVPIGAPWYADLLAELLSFPAGKHDDQVDALGLVGQLLATMVRGAVPAKPEIPEDQSGYKDADLSTKAESFLTY